MVVGELKLVKRYDLRHLIPIWLLVFSILINNDRAHSCPAELLVRVWFLAFSIGMIPQPNEWNIIIAYIARWIALNSYSMSAPEEDKAEIYAGLFRHAPALLYSDDNIIARKAHEMKYINPSIPTTSFPSISSHHWLPSIGLDWRDFVPPWMKHSGPMC